MQRQSLVQNRWRQLTAAAKAGDRQRIPDWGLLLLGIVGATPLIAATLRLTALQSAHPTGLLAIGDWLNREIHLFSVPASDRDMVLYVLLLPLSALLVALTRLTLGLRILGFRAILIAIGFHEIGVLPSLMLIAVVAIVVLSVRPIMRRFGLPLFARVAAILCLVAITMISGLILGSALDSPALWSFTFFPVVILAMLAESIAATVARESTAMAAWRTGATIALAGIIALLGQITELRQLMLACPELIFSFLVATILVAELMNIRLFEDFIVGNDKSDGGTKNPKLSIILIRDRFPEGVFQRVATKTPARYRRTSLQHVVDALRERGHQVSVVEGDGLLGSRLREITPRPLPGRAPTTLALNFSGGVQGAGRLLQVPVICEALGLPYTGPGPRSPLLISDRVACLSCLSAAGLETPTILAGVSNYVDLHQRQFPLSVRYRWDMDRCGETVHDQLSLERAIAKVVSTGEDVLIEKPPSGRSLTLIVLSAHPGTPIRLLPVVERRRRSRWVEATGLDTRSLEALNTCARLAFEALSCRDLARFDVVLGPDDEVTIVEVRPIELPSRRGPIAAASQAANISLADLTETLAIAALARSTTYNYQSPSQKAAA